MGAWGAGPFENDDASDWVYELEEGGVKHLQSTLQAVTKAEKDDYLEIDACSNAIAAAEVVAALQGRAAKDLPEEVTAWLETKPKGRPDLVVLAKDAVARVAREGELKELWDEAEPKDAAAWKQSVNDLLQRLA